MTMQITDNTTYYTDLIPVLSSTTPDAVFTGDVILGVELQPEDDRVMVLLRPAQRAWNPASTKEERQIHGPAIVLYEGLNSRAGIRAIVF